MNCIIPAQNTKVFSKAIYSLAKIGDEIFLEATKDKLKLITMNMGKTVCSQFCFLESFFSSYDINDEALTEENKETITCKLFMKSLLPLFKGNLEKKLDFLKIEFDVASDFIVFKMKYKYDQILMIHKLRLMELEILSIGIVPNEGSNNLFASSSLFNQVLSMFNVSDNEITLEIMNSRVLARNFYPGSACNPKLMRCEVKLNAGEFFIYDVKYETIINFALKPLRTIISFAETFNLQIGLNFDSGGKPLTILMKNPIFEIFFMVSTLNPNGDAASTMASTSIPSTTQRNPRNLNITLEDQQAIENENWDDMSEFVQTKPSLPSSSKKKENFQTLLENAKNKNTSERSKNSSKICENSEQNSQNNRHTSIIECNVDLDFVPDSPESPKRKKLKYIFSRCYEPTIYLPSLGKEVSGNSDSE